jgi:hypothetical protein
MRTFRVLDQLMLSLGDKEATYDAAPAAWTLGAAFQLFDFGENAIAEWPDVVQSDRGTVHGSQFGTTQRIIRQDVRLAYGEEAVRPTHLGGLAALALGSVAANLQDAALTAYRHKLVPVAASTALPSVGGQEKVGGEQTKYTGLVGSTFRLYRNGDFWAVEAALVGSGTRATASDAFPAKLTTQLPLRWQDTYCWLETGEDISIDASPTQGAENISTGTADDFRTRINDLSFSWDNALALDKGYAPGGGLVRTHLDHGAGRGGSVRVELDMNAATLAAERAYYSGQVAAALEIEVDSGTVIAATGAYKYGFDLILPCLKLKPIGRGVREGGHTITFESELFDDGTNPVAILYVYDNQTAYLA